METEKACAVQNVQAMLLPGGKYKPTDEGGSGLRDLNPMCHAKLYLGLGVSGKEWDS